MVVSTTDKSRLFVLQMVVLVVLLVIYMFQQYLIVKTMDKYQGHVQLVVLLDMVEQAQ